MISAESRFGATPRPDGRTTFRVWAPAQAEVVVQADGGDRFPLVGAPGGWFEATLPLPAGTAYRHLVRDAGGGEIAIADPASRAQVDDVHGPSLVVDPSAYAWRCADWRGRPWAETVLYELHVGLCDGFAGVEARLPALAALGFTAIELMPLADFPGPRNWGYDGVLPYAPDASYGTPDDLRRLIDRAHELGLMVFLDVVYNHFGPDGNFLGTLAPEFFREDVSTPWGSAIDFRRPEVRAFFTQNAIEWIVDYRFDGLRLDAVHAIGEPGWLDEMALAVRAACDPGRHVHLVIENEHNVADLLTPEPHRFDAQWNDDAHHAIHVLLTGANEGYYRDHADAPAERLARVLAEGFDYQGQPSALKDGAPRGTPSGRLPPTAFVDALQNHDQIGNRAFGDRLLAIADPDGVRAAVVLLLLSPHVPLVFMGEEAGSTTPFLFFTSHGDELAEQVRHGRRAEFAAFRAFQDPEVRERIPDPNDPATFEASRPVDGADADAWRRLYRELLTLRRERIAPVLPGAQSLGAHPLGAAAVTARWRLGDGSTLVVAANLGADPVVWRQAPDARHRLHGTGTLRHGHLGGRSAFAYLLPALDDGLRALAEAAGIEVEWEDFEFRRHLLASGTVASLLEALGFACGDEDAIAASRARLDAESLPALATARVGEAIALDWPGDAGEPPAEATLILESGARRVCPLERPATGTAPGQARRFVLGPIDEPGYHRLVFGSVDAADARSLVLAIAPRRAFQALDTAERAWGTAVQLHALRPATTRAEADPGLGDYGTLADLARLAGEHGADALAVSPTHAGFAADPARYSPYSPSSRLASNVVYIDPSLPFGAEAAANAATAADVANAGPLSRTDPPGDDALIDWPRAGRARLRRLRALFDAHAAEIDAAEHERAPDPHRALHAEFEALHAHFLAQGVGDWPSWPEAFRDPGSEAVRAFVAEHAADVRFHAWLQRTTVAQLDRAQAAARDAGMRIGLVADLAIGMSPHGSHAWAAREDLLGGVAIGAPPDKFNPAGQSWGLAAFSPRALRTLAFEPFLATLRLAMRHAGGVRIDHVLGLRRLWLVPEGAPPNLGGFLSYPLDDLLNLVILESHRNRAIVIGEDLGTVPDGFREKLADAGIAGMEVLWFQREKDESAFIEPARWSADAVAMTTTHDLPTVAGWWTGRDLEWREKTGHEHDPAGARAARGRQREQLAAIAPRDGGPHESAPRDGGPENGADAGLELALAIVARSPAPLAIVPIEDLLGLVEQPNLPGTTDEHPNWRRRLPRPVDRLFDEPAAAVRIGSLNALRPGRFGSSVRRDRIRSPR